MHKNKYISIMDTTLRDGEQTSGISYLADEKLMIAKKLLCEVKVDRIEIASCFTSPREQKTIKAITNWASQNGFIDRIEVLAFVDHQLSVDWLMKTKSRRINLLTKGSERHCKVQLKKTPKQHLQDIERTLQYAQDQRFTCMVYLEDWSSGMLDSVQYVWEMLDHYVKWPFQKIHLPDTLGILTPEQVTMFISETRQRFPDSNFEFHAHNDYGLAVANSFAAINAGIDGVHVTVNGLGERAGNTSLAEMIAVINDHTDCKTHIDERQLKPISAFVETLSGSRIANNTPIVGDNVFTQVAGIHADGDKKGNLYQSKLNPQRFGRTFEYGLSKLSGKSNLDLNLKKIGIELTSEQRKILLNKIIKLSEQKEIITTDDLPFLIADLFPEFEEQPFKVLQCVITSNILMSAVANIRVSYRNKEYDANAVGNGGYDAFMNALQKITPKMKIKLPCLIDFEIYIPPGGRTSALVEAIIVWEGNFRTRGISSDQVLASIKATERMINLIDAKFRK